MAINTNGKDVVDIVADGKNVSEVYAGSNKVWGKDDGGPVPPYAVIHAFNTDPSLTDGWTTLMEPDSTVSFPGGDSKTASLQAFLAPDSNVSVYSGGQLTYRIRRVGNNILEAFARGIRGGTTTVTTTVYENWADAPYIYVYSGTRGSPGAFDYGFEVNIQSNHASREFANIKGSIFSQESLKLRGATVTSSGGAYCARIHRQNPGPLSIGANLNNAISYAYFYNVGWEHYEGPRRINQNSLRSSLNPVPIPPSPDHNYVGDFYESNITTRRHPYTRPEGVTYDEVFQVSGTYQEGLFSGGGGGQGGRSGSYNGAYNGHCRNAQNEPGGCSVMEGTGAAGTTLGGGVSTGLHYFNFARAVNLTSRIREILVGRGSQLATGLYYNNEVQNHTRNAAAKTSDIPGDGGFGGAGGVPDPSKPTYLISGSSGTAGNSGSFARNSYYNSGVRIEENGEEQDSLMHHTNDAYWSQADHGPNSSDPDRDQENIWRLDGLTTVQKSIRDLYPSELDGFVESFPRDHKYHFPESPYRFYTHRNGKTFYYNTGVVVHRGKSVAGPGGAGGNAGGLGQRGGDGKDGGFSFSNAGGNGIVAIYYEFQEPRL